MAKSSRARQGVRKVMASVAHGQKEVNVRVQMIAAAEMIAMIVHVQMIAVAATTVRVLTTVTTARALTTAMIVREMIAVRRQMQSV